MVARGTDKKSLSSVLSAITVLSIMGRESPGQVLCLVKNSGNLGGFDTWPEFPKVKKSLANREGEKRTSQKE